MIVTRTSIYSGITRTREIDITDEQFAAWQQGTHIQNAAPHLSAADREFLISGVTQEEWDEMLGDFDDD